MKKWAIPMLALMSVSALYGCGSQKQDITDVLDKLMNFKLENIEDYKSIGFGAIEESSKEAKGRIKGTPRKEEQTESDFGTAYYGGGPEPLYYESPSPFYLIGQLESGTIEKLKFQDNTDDLSIPISACLDCGDFLVFSPGENRNDSGPVSTHFAPITSMATHFFCLRQAEKYTTCGLSASISIEAIHS